MEKITRIEAKAKGLKRYFTDISCKHGHIAERYVVNRDCVVCRHEKTNRQYRINNDIWRNYRKRPDVKARKNKSRREKWGDADRAALRAYRAANKNKLKGWLRKYYLEHRDELIAAARKWDEEHPEQKRINGAAAAARRRARKRKAGGKHTKQDLIELLQAQNYQCTYCRADLRKVKKHLDHIVPLAKGGTNDRKNLQWLCVECNQRKHTMHHTDFVRELGLTP